MVTVAKIAATEVNESRSITRFYDTSSNESTSIINFCSYDIHFEGKSQRKIREQLISMESRRCKPVAKLPLAKIEAEA